MRRKIERIVVGKNGFAVNDKAHCRPFVPPRQRYHLGAYLKGRFPLVVKDNHVFVMGDNREDSLDSRSNEIGLIEERQILGKAVFLILPGQAEDKSRDLKRIGVLN